MWTKLMIRTGLFWVWPWEYIDGPIFYSIGLGFWSLWWAPEKIWTGQWENGNLKMVRYIRIELNRD
jgi:hypothetical protein